MAVYSDIRKALRRAVLASLNEFPDVEVIFSHVSGAELPNPYIVINILGIEQKGKHMTSTLASVMGTYGWGLGWGVNYSDSDAERYINVAASYELTVQFGFCGSLAGDMAHSFTQRVNNNPISLEAFKAEKLSVMRKSPIRRAPQKRETRWVEYFNQDVIFSYIVNTQQPIDWVEGVVIADETSEIPVIIKIPESIVYP